MKRQSLIPMNSSPIPPTEQSAFLLGGLKQKTAVGGEQTRIVCPIALKIFWFHP